jgi:hypothetical protein
MYSSKEGGYVQAVVVRGRVAVHEDSDDLEAVANGVEQWTTIERESLGRVGVKTEPPRLIRSPACPLTSATVRRGCRASRNSFSARRAKARRVGWGQAAPPISGLAPPM